MKVIPAVNFGVIQVQLSPKTLDPLAVAGFNVTAPVASVFVGSARPIQIASGCRSTGCGPGADRGLDLQGAGGTALARLKESRNLLRPAYSS